MEAALPSEVASLPVGAQIGREDIAWRDPPVPRVNIMSDFLVA